MREIIDFNKAKTQEEIEREYSVARSQTLYVDTQGALRDFVACIEQSGIGTLAISDIELDGEIHRFSLHNDNSGDKSGWYVFYNDNIPAGSFGSWKDDFKETFVYQKAVKNSYEVNILIKETNERTKRLKEAKRVQEQNESARQSLERYNNAQIVTESTYNAYLQRKQVFCHGLRLHNRALLVPMCNAKGELRNIQRIFSNGKKYFTKNGEKSGCFFPINGNNDTVFICEGLATGISVYKTTGNTVFVAFDSGNLMHVAKVVKNSMSNSNIILAADNDQFTYINNVPHNTGLICATKAAKEIGAHICYPIFKDLTDKILGHRPTDFNDLYIMEGADAVKYQLHVSHNGPNIFNWGVQLFEGKAPPVRWLVKDILPLSAPCMLTAQGGTGKGMMTLDLALSIAEEQDKMNLNTKKWIGKKVVDTGTAVIFSAEDNKDSIHQRLELLDPTGERRKRAQNNFYIIPLPNSGGPIQLITSEGFKKGYATTEAFENIKKQLKGIPNLKFINFDPLASFVGVDINADPQAGAFVQGILANLAEELQATILVSHHMSKMQKGGIRGIDDARNAIRGTSALVDGVRLVMAVWGANEELKKKICADNDIDAKNIFEFAVVKSNSKADTDIKTLVRKDNGLLEVLNVKVDYHKKTLEDLIVWSVAERAELGRPFSKTGQGGVYSRRAELPKELHSLGKHKIESIVQKLLENGRVVGATYKGTVAKFLDVPEGKFAQGEGVIEAGWSENLESTKN